MPDFKMVWSFAANGQKGGKWSEVWYRSASSITEASVFTNALLNKRLKPLHSTNTLLKIRVSEVLNPRSTTVVNVRKVGVEVNFDPNPIATAAVVTVSSSVKAATRRWWMRGGDVDDMHRDKISGNDVFSAGFLTDVKDCLIAFAAAGFEILPVQKPAVNGFGPSNIKQVDGSLVQGKSVLTLDAPLTANAGDLVIITKTSPKDLPGLNGRFTVIASVGPLLTIAYVTPQAQTITTLTGQVRKLGYISGATIDPAISGPAFIGSRKSHSPFTGSRGAKSAKRGLRTSR